MGSKRNWFVDKARGSATRLGKLWGGRHRFGIDVSVGGAVFTCDLDETALAAVKVRHWRDAMGEFFEFKAPRGEQAFIKGLAPLDVGMLAQGEQRPKFLVFSLRERLPPVHRSCALVIRARSAAGAGQLVYQTALRDPHPVIIGLSDDVDRILFMLRLAGRGTIPRLKLSVSALSEWDRAEDSVVRDALAAGLPSDEIDWVHRLSRVDGIPLVAGALAAQGWALAARLRDSAAQLMLAGRQARDLRRLAPDTHLDAYISKVEEAAGYAMHAEALTAAADREMRRLTIRLDPGMATEDAPFEYRGARSGDVWRRKIVEAALAVRAEHGLLAAMSQLWRYADPTEFRQMLEAFAEALHLTDPELARHCLLLGLGFDPSQQRLRAIAVKLFHWGQLGPAGELIADVHTELDTRATGELRLALTLKRELSTLLPPRGEGWSPPRDGKIAYVAAATLPWVNSGYTARTQELLSALAAMGEQVVCFTRPGFPWDRERTAPTDRESPDRVRVGAVEYIHSRVHSVIEDPAGYMTQAANALIERFRADPPAIVHAASNHRNALPALIAARTIGAPFIYEVRGFWELSTAARLKQWEQTERFAYERGMERFVAGEADLVLTITDAVRRELLPSLRDDAQVHVLSNGVDPERFRPMPRPHMLAAELGIEPGDIVLVYAGSLLEYEGLDDVVDAIGRLRERGVPARLIIVGDGRSRKSLERQVSDAKLEQRVRFIGRVTPDAVLDYLALADVVPIVRKPFRVCELVSPLKPFEAMAMEKVVIVSDLPALTEIVEDGARGCICRPGDPAHLAEVVASLYQNPARRAEIGRAAREWVIAERSWTAHARQLAALYQQFRA